MRAKLAGSLGGVVLVTLFALGCGDGATSGHDHSSDDHTHEPGDAGDDFAKDACRGLDAEGTVVVAATDHEGAEAVVMTPGETTWVVRLPEGATGYASVMLPTDHTDWAIFVDQPNVVVSLTNHDNDRFDVVPENPDEACPDDLRVDARIHIHEGGHYIVEFAPEGAREIRFQIFSQTVGHMDPGDADAIAQGACHALDDGHVPLAASSTPEAALAGDVLAASGGFYHLMLPDGPSFVAVHLQTDHTDWAVFVSDPNVALSLSNDDVGVFGITPHNPDAACADELQVDSRIHIHQAGIFLLELSAEGPREILFEVVSEQVGHGGGGDEDHTDENGDHDHG